jgi:hypothetical protein
VVDRLLDTFGREADRRRAESFAADPARAKRVDARLNETRVNILVYGYGETHEPPLTERAFIGSYTVISYDRHWREFSLVSLTHDIRAPEIERRVNSRTAMKIDQAFKIGGFELVREVIESATGLAIDFAVSVPDEQIAALIDSVYHGIDVQNPKAFSVHPFYLGGVKYPAGSFAAGKIHLDGKAVLQYIKTVPIERAGTQDKQLEHNVRKHRVFRGLVEATKANAANPLFLGRLLAFLNEQGRDERIQTDFDVRSLVISTVGGAIGSVGGALLAGNTSVAVPEIAKTMYIHDPAAGDGGVRWVRGDPNPITRRDVAAGRYPDPNMAVPVNANPAAADLVQGYWASLRAVVKRRLLA